MEKAPLSLKIRPFLSELAWQISAPAAFLLGMLGFFPYWSSFWLSYDEGYQLMKALMVVRGYSLYGQIWDDQAPLLTYLLAGLIRIFGNDTELSRKLILLFSCVLLWAAVQYLRLTWGKLHAVVGAILLVILPNFLVLSASVLVGQPSIAFLSVSMLALAGWHRRRKPVYLILSAAAMSLSLLTKLFTGFVAPIFLLGLAATEYFQLEGKKDWLRVLRPALVWGASLGLLTLGLGCLMVDPAYVLQLILPHLSATQATTFPPNEQLLSINYYLQPSWPILLAAPLGAVYAIKKKRWLALYPLAWMTAAYAILLVLKPVWWHHQLLVTLPAVILAAGVIGGGLEALVYTVREPSILKKTWLLLTAGLVTLSLAGVVLVPTLASFLRTGAVANSEARNPAEDRFMRRILNFAPQTHWMLTDMPMYAFQAGLSVPPDLTVISWKRFAAGELSEEKILATLRELRPEQVLFGRFTLPQVDQYLAENYRKVLERDSLKLYIRSDLH